VPFTVFATVGLINAMNMIDGSDGLAGSLGFAALVMLCAAALYAGNLALANRALAVAGAVAGFLFWNLRFPWRTRARTFMGDAGSGFLGLVVAWVAFRLTQNPGHPVTPILAVWLLPIPVMDCLVLIVRMPASDRCGSWSGWWPSAWCAASPRRWACGSTCPSRCCLAPMCCCAWAGTC